VISIDAKVTGSRSRARWPGDRMRAMSLSRPALSLLSSSAVTLCLVVACGAGPTDGPRTPDDKIVVGGVRGDAGLTMAQTPASESTGRSRPRPAIAEPTKPANEEESAPATDPGPDPMHGTFLLPQAVAGLPASGPLVATIKTSKGELRCKLFDEKAPIAVANFVGLARGTRPFKDKGRWVTRAAYDGTTFHRVIKGFMVQGGDPQGTGRGEPGYVFKDELWTGNGSKHDRPGLLCMANRGPDTNGMQFFITDASAPHLDRSYTIFGECSPVSVVHAIANAPTEPGDRPVQEITIDKVEISRGGVTASPAAAGGNGAAAKDAGAPPPAPPAPPAPNP
jgi:peptidyl-prolyl cis-trans isomerase A (cyclophilin A)